MRPNEWDDGQAASSLPVTPSVVASNHISARSGMCFKETSTSINNV
jgi:hypothetical protein